MKKKNKSFVMPTYGEKTLEFQKGKGCYLYTKNNEKYLDFASGIAVNSLGHCHPRLIKALNKQSKELWHVSNLYIIKKQEELAKLLCNNSFADKIFFTNSGTESIECGIKIIRSYHNHYNTGKKEIITFQGAFHGRTYGALSAQKNKKYSNSFGPFLSGFKQVELYDPNLEKKSCRSCCCGSMEIIGQLLLMETVWVRRSEFVLFIAVRPHWSSGIAVRPHRSSSLN